MKVLVTGGAGFIGSNLVDSLLLNGNEVLVLDNFSTGKINNLRKAEALAERTGAGLQIVNADIRGGEAAEIVEAFRPVIVIHLAAQIDVRKSVGDPVFDCDVNLTGSVNVLRASASAGVKNFIFASSGGCIYGEPDYLPVDEDHPKRPDSPYGVSKNAVSYYLNYFRLNHGLNYTTLAFGNVYGPRQDPFGEAGVIAIFINKMLAREQTIIYGDGEQLRDYVYVGDVCDAFLAAIERPANNTINIGTGVGTSVIDVHSQIQKQTESHLAPLFDEPRQGELYKVYLSFQKAKNLLDWQPKTSLTEGLRITVDHFTKKHLINKNSVT